MSTITITTINNCPDCGKLKEFYVEKSVGDKVNFTVVKQYAKSTRYSVREGTVIGIEGDEVTVKGKGRSGNFTRKPNQLTDLNGKSALSMALLGGCECKPTKRK